MANIVDNRRKDYSVDNRRKYMEREGVKVRQAVRKKLRGVGIKDLDKGQDVGITIENSTEEVDIGYSSNKGAHEVLGTGNKKYKVGESFPMPSGGPGSGSKADPNAEDSEGEFSFALTAQEFMDVFFDDLGLPFQVKKILTETESNIWHQAGFVSDGSPSRLSVVRTYRNAIGRTSAEYTDYMNQLEEEEDEDKRLEIEEKIKNIPLFRDVDLRFTNWVPEPTVKFKSVMFCVLDVSGSVMDEQRTLAKQFFMLLYVFLRKCYTSVDIVFVRHTTHAEETDEQTFFYDNMSGGTVLSTSLEKVDEIIKERYANQSYNIYVAQASDGDNYSHDNEKFFHLLKDIILPQVQYYVYIEVPDTHWGNTNTIRFGTPFYKQLVEDFVNKEDEQDSQVAAKIITRAGDIWKAFYKLFKKRGLSDGLFV